MTETLPNEIAKLLARPVAVLGAGVSGQGAVALLRSVGAESVVYDGKAEGSANAFRKKQAQSHGLVVFSPGFAPDHDWLAAARSAGCTCLGELDFASLFWRGRVVAVTGTNGKTTLTEFLAHALNSVGRPAHAAGNVGHPFSRLVVEHNGGESLTAVCEVSSFQAETLRHLRPDATLWTNFAEDHLERHPGMDAYFAAKLRLIEMTREGGVFAGSSVQAYAKQSNRSLPGASCIATEGQQSDARLSDSAFAAYPQFENFLLAAAWWRSEGLPMDRLYAAAHSFRLGPHRMARVAEKGGVTFWNDSKATNFHAVEAALTRFPAPVLWIGGGKAKGGDLAGFVKRIAGRIRHAFLIGETRPVLATFCNAYKVPASPCDTLEQAVRGAFAKAASGDHILLSPGFASFDMFRGYDDRGHQFEAIVEKL